VVHKAALLADIYAAAQKRHRWRCLWRLTVQPLRCSGSCSRSIYRSVACAKALRYRPKMARLDNPDRWRLMAVPGVAPVTALTILAEAGDPRRFAYYRQFLKFCGMNISTYESGPFRGVSRPSKYGDARLRIAFWMAA
jgi:Transposase IS116/IS110/IS902 family